jgi:DNA-binding CsgD family transcriptional regulator
MDHASATLLQDSPAIGPARAAPSTKRQCLPSRPQPQILDEDAVAVDDCRVRYRVRARIVEELLQAKTGVGRRQVLRTALGLMGFDSLTYTITEGLSPHGGRVHAVFQSGVEADWLQHYCDARMDRVDPRVRAAADSATPFVWDLDLLASGSSAASAPCERLLTDMGDHDMRSGVSFGIAITGTTLKAIVHLVSSRAHRDFIGDAVLGQALIFSISLHEFLSCCKLPGPEPSDDVPVLTRMERNILAGLSAGDGDKEIGARLCMTHYNVDYHLRIIRRKLGGLNRAHLAYLSGRYGLV